jgi:hypothetical protein
MAAKPNTVTHRFNVWVTVPAVSGDGWNQYPDYGAAEVGRWLRRVLHDTGCGAIIPIVEHAETTEDTPS